MQPNLSILVVDDDTANATSLQKIFEREGFRVRVAHGGTDALDQSRADAADVVLTDLMMPGMDGIELVKALHTVAPHSEVIVMTAHGTIETAVTAMREGAYDFVEKPLKRMAILKAVQKAAERRRLVQENSALKRELSTLRDRRIVGASPSMRHALDTASQAAPSTATVLILGESGTGKELIARHIHEQSGRRGDFVAVNLAALPETIVEAELFGHERGAFTGAVARREGRVARAAGGTLFLDEIGDLAPSIQVKLLRVLQEGEYEPVGGRPQRADFRLIAATNRDLEEAVAAGDFREDLFYRLNVITITCPRLADRRDDVPLLVEHFLEFHAQKNGRAPLTVTPAAMERLVAYDWPGNVRELENVMQRAVVLGKGATLDLDALPAGIATAEGRGGSLAFSVGTPLDEIERRVILATLEHTKGDKQLAARLLGISTRTIYRKTGTGSPPPTR